MANFARMENSPLQEQYEAGEYMPHSQTSRVLLAPREATWGNNWVQQGTRQLWNRAVLDQKHRWLATSIAVRRAIKNRSGVDVED